MLYITRKHNNNMPMLSAISNELYVNKAFVGLNGSGYQLSGRGYELAGTGVPKRKIKKAIKDTGEVFKPKKGKDCSIST